MATNLPPIDHPSTAPPPPVSVGVNRASQQNEDAIQLRRRIAQSNAKLQSAAWLIDVMDDLAQTDGFTLACQSLVEQIAQHLLSPSVVFVAAQKWNDQGSVRDTNVVAASDQPLVDQESELARGYRQAALESFEHQEPIFCDANRNHDPKQADAPENRYAHRELMRRHGSVLSIPLISNPLITNPLITNQNHHLGVLLVLAIGGGQQDQTQTLDFARAIQQPIASVLSQSRRADGGRWSRLIRRFQACSPPRKFAALIVSAAALISLVMPVQHRIGGTFDLQPEHRQFGIAPFDGVLREILVSPGDSVEAGQILAAMDDRDLVLQRNEMRAKKIQLRQQQEQQWIVSDSAEAVAIGYEIEQIEAKIGLIDEKLRRAKLIASDTGVVLASPVEDRFNVPVRQGEVFFELASTTRLRVDVLVQPEDIGHVGVGQTIWLHVAGFGGLFGESLRATVERILPEAVTRDGDHGFIVRCSLENTDGRLQVGMTGRAKIDAGNAALGWTLFRRPMDRLAGCF